VGSVLRVDWDVVAADLVEQGWARAAGAVPADRLATLGKPDEVSWEPVPPEQGVVHQAGSSAYQPLADASGPVQALAGELVAGLSPVLAKVGGAAAPAELRAFNEVTWSHYPEGYGHITAHRDPIECEGVIVVLTLAGRAPFQVHRGDDRPVTWWTGAGDLVLLRGGGWPDGSDRRPRHGVEPPEGSDRQILTFRSNRGGTGAPYSYG
jgi:hypothetical protein